MSSFTKLIGKKATVGKTSSKKSTAPTIKLSSSLSKSLDDLIAAKASVKSAVATQKQAESKLLEHAVEIQDKDGLNGHYSGTYELVGKNNTSKFISTDRFTVSQDSEVHEGLVDIVGKKGFEKMVEENVTVTLCQDVFTDPEKQKLLVDLLGDKFDDLFETTIKYSSKKGLKESIYNLVKNDADKLEEVRSLLPQYKSAIK